MKILYGVQGTGNGHITRARMMAEYLQHLPVTVDYLFSGKDDDYFNMELFNNYRTFKGLSFVADKGDINFLKTLKRNNIRQFFRDVKTLNVQDYDLVINDFEPISAWAANKNHIPCISLSHQNSFRYKVPVRGNNLIASSLLKWFAPAQQHIAFHWYHFNAPILPPMIKTDNPIKASIPGKILVYLPFLDMQQYHDLFMRFSEVNFVQYHPIEQSQQIDNVSCKPLSREGFMQDFSDCEGIICSAGFGACSEALHYGKKLMVIPLQGQMEQLSNAAALQQLGYAEVRNTVNPVDLNDWLMAPSPGRVHFPNVAQALSEWIISDQRQSLEDLSAELWNQVNDRRADLDMPTKPDLELPDQYIA